MESNIGERIKAVRDAERLTQPKFAEAIGLTSGSISLFESGKSGVSRATVVAICNTFGVSRKWLLEGEGPMYAKAEEYSEIIPELTEVLANNPAVLRVLQTAAQTMTVADWRKLNDFLESLGVGK